MGFSNHYIHFVANGNFLSLLRKDVEYFYCRGSYLLHLTETPSSVRDANFEPLLSHYACVAYASPTSFSSIKTVSRWKSEGETLCDEAVRG